MDSGALPVSAWQERALFRFAFRTIFTERKQMKSNLRLGFLPVTIIIIITVFFFTVSAPAGPLPVAVSIPPQKYFVEKIAGNNVRITVMVKPGDNPHVYEPKPRQMKSLTQARLYFAIGINFEKTWLDRFRSVNSEMKIVHTDKGIKKIPVAKRVGNGGDGHHEADHFHSSQVTGDSNPDPHVWLSPPNVRTIALNIMKALIDLDPDKEGEYRSNYESFDQELGNLHEELEKMFADIGKRSFITFHPSWGYFAKTYNLNQVPVEVEGKTPKLSDLKLLTEYANKKDIRVIFIQPQFSQKSAAVIAKSINAKVVTVDPLSENWMENLKKVARAFQSALK